MATTYFKATFEDGRVAVRSTTSRAYAYCWISPRNVSQEAWTTRLSLIPADAMRADAQEITAKEYRAVLADRKAEAAKAVLAKAEATEAAAATELRDLFAGIKDPTVWKRREIEVKVARRVAASLIGGLVGYSIDVFDGEETTLRQSTDVNAVLNAMFTTDEDVLVVRYKGGKIGSVNFVYGNSGWDVVSDYSTSLEPIMGPVLEWAEQFDR